MSEHDEQTALMQWCVFAGKKYPELALLFAVPNGEKRPINSAKRLKAEGVRPGVPDLCLPVARKGYHGLFIEMKAPKGHPTNAQLAWLVALEDQGYKAALCYGWEGARLILEQYLT